MPIPANPNDQHAFEQVYRAHWLRLYRMALRIVERDAIARDMVQEAFISFWEKSKKQTIVNEEAYLYQAVKFQCFMHLRNNTISERHLNRLNALAASNVIEEEFDLKELEIALNQGIANLPEKCREVFCLSRFESLPNKKIAERLKISPKTVENQITKALRLLRVSVGKLAVLLWTAVLGPLT
jgi:RNA polymerase sigma-70 factor (family 1)